MKQKPRMRVIFIFVILLQGIFCFSQQNQPILILVGRSEAKIRNYFDSLNRLKANSYYKIEKDVTADGDMILKVAFALDDEAFYSCTDVMAIFQRENGNEICVQQAIVGHTKYSQTNLNFIKDNFTYVSENKWVKPLANDLLANIEATFKRGDSDHPYYQILYTLVEKK